MRRKYFEQQPYFKNISFIDLYKKINQAVKTNFWTLHGPIKLGMGITP